MKKIVLFIMLLVSSISLFSCGSVNCKVLDVPQDKVNPSIAHGLIANLEEFEFSLPNYKEFEDTKDINDKYFEKYSLIWVDIPLSNSEGPDELVLEQAKMEKCINSITGENKEILVFTFSIPHQISLDASEYIPGKTINSLLIRVPHYKNIKNFETNYGVRIYDRETNTQGSLYLPEGVDIRWNDYSGFYD